MKLYEQTGDMLRLQEQIENGELSNDDVADTLEGMELDFNDKAVKIMQVAQSFDGDVSVLDAEIKRLQGKKKAIKANQDKLKEYLRYNMETSGITKISCPMFNITLRKPVQKVEVLDVDLIPDEYLTVKTEIKPDLKAILKSLKAGEEVTGVMLQDGISGLLIK
ncbi:MAG: siphovirus Gp157 family protein [Emcibacteraceae bacterium]|nr:siphovirus Gp157 family protein [Emcibacteraceae bacterium]